MVTQNMVSTHAGEIGLYREIKNPICDCSSTNQMPKTDQITDNVSYVCTVSELPSNISTMQLLKPANIYLFIITHSLQITFLILIKNFHVLRSGSGSS